MRRVLLLTAALALALPPGTAQVDTTVRDQLERQAAEYQDLLQGRRDEIARIEEALGDTRATLEERIHERDRVSALIMDLAADEAALEARIAELDAERAVTEERIAAEEANLEQLRGRISALLVNLHRQRTGRSVNALAGAESLHDLRVQNVYLSLLSQQDVRLVREVDRQLQVLTDLSAELDRQRAELETNRTALAETRLQQERTRAQLQGLIAELNATEEGQQAQQVALLKAEQQLERELADTRARLQREVERLRAEERRLREEAQRFVEDRARREALEAEADETRERILALTSPQEPNTAGFVGPLEGGTLLSTYGEGNNSFVSLRATEAGAAVFAVQAGVVIAAQSIGANDGWMVAVRHDPELATVYTNLREPPLQVGDRVQRGQIIGYLGGGTLPPPDVLRLYARLNQDGREAFVDPLPLLGL
ncbi:MAG: peptidoglycan DD-metalloendopeptidase family protein [Trueperaceae bacterium]